MRNTPTTVVVLLAAVGAAALVGCGANENSPSGSAESTSSPEVSGVASAPRQQTRSPNEPAEEDTMMIDITVNEQRFSATLTDSPASRDLLAQLPQTVEMTDHGGVEKTGPLPTPLSLTGQPSGADPEVGDLGYYAPGNDLVLYYGDQFYFPGIVILGTLEGDAAQKISELAGSITATVEAR